MDPPDLLDYALGTLGAPRREQIERRIASDPELAERVARLIRNLGRLLDDGRDHRTMGLAPFRQTPAESLNRDDPLPRLPWGDRNDQPQSDSH